MKDEKGNSIAGKKTVLIQVLMGSSILGLLECLLITNTLVSQWPVDILGFVVFNKCSPLPERARILSNYYLLLCLFGIFLC